MKKTITLLIAVCLVLIMILTVTAVAGEEKSAETQSSETKNTEANTEKPQIGEDKIIEANTDKLQIGEDKTTETQSNEQKADGAITEERQTDDPVTLIVFAAASMTETMEKIADLYKETAPNVEIIYTFDSSGTLKTQIEEGAECDIFISAAPKQMNQLDAAIDEKVGNTDGLDFVLSDTRIDLLENKVALAVPEGNPAGIESYDDMIEKLKAGTILLVMGNSDVPVGQYTQKIFAYYGVDEADLQKKAVLTYGTNVKEVTTQVSENTVDCGIIYATDAFSAGLEVVDTATKEMCGQVIYPAAVLNITKNEEAAKAFLEYLTGEEAGAVFESVGFSPIAGTKGKEQTEETGEETSKVID